MKAIISRTYGKFETQGLMLVIEGENILFHCVTLELPDLGNQKNISCIPEGKYKVKKEYNDKFKWHFRIYDVPGRAGILIHKGNYAAGKKVDIEGCILVGIYFTDLNQDGNADVADSTTAMAKLISILPLDFEIHILS